MLKTKNKHSVKRKFLLALALSCNTLSADSFKDAFTKGDFIFAGNKVESPTKRYADKSAFYMGLGYQLGSIQHNNTNINLTSAQVAIKDKSYTLLNSALSPTYKRSYVSNGFGLMLGYKWVGKHKETKWFGFRWGLFYDMSASVYGRGNLSYNGYNTFTANPFAYQKTESIVISTYGTYMDLLLNAYNGDKFFAGFSVGVAFAGVNYDLSDKKTYKNYLKSAFGGKINDNAFQFLVNLGVRLGGKHNQFGFGIKIPTYYLNNYMAMNNPHNDEKDILKTTALLKGGNIVSLPYREVFRRNYSIYFNYIYSF
ncbi:outer membrane protein [Helicobacter cetorum]|uniref:Outer membrane protein Horl n=1 Tax=Helicobacter cetorum (strain ATCC BAA-429 / MIT 00-7128) TaxID=182217 RepID=I0EP04_HELC0|nr:outer membrane protein [Helicobacter cetorum]AFI04673.1 outer membrane protein Horl [Helicobacter cetorum MIT 00-7128]